MVKRERILNVENILKVKIINPFCRGQPGSIEQWGNAAPLGNAAALCDASPFGNASHLCLAYLLTEVAL
jgi:hypothetical protein